MLTTFLQKVNYILYSCYIMHKLGDTMLKLFDCFRSIKNKAHKKINDIENKINPSHHKHEPITDEDIDEIIKKLKKKSSPQSKVKRKIKRVFDS